MADRFSSQRFGPVGCVSVIPYWSERSWSLRNATIGRIASRVQQVNPHGLVRRLSDDTCYFDRVTR